MVLGGFFGQEEEPNSSGKCFFILMIWIHCWNENANFSSYFCKLTFFQNYLNC